MITLSIIEITIIKIIINENIKTYTLKEIFEQKDNDENNLCADSSGTAYQLCCFCSIGG